jgi:tetratricopeptide (TPR) repeat protein
MKVVFYFLLLITLNVKSQVKDIYQYYIFSGHSNVKDSDKKIFELDDSLKNNYNDHFLYFKRGYLKYLKKDYIGSNHDFVKMLEFEKSPRAFYYANYYKGLIKFKLEDYRGAIVDFSKSINELSKFDNGMISDDNWDQLSNLTNWTLEYPFDYYLYFLKGTAEIKINKVENAVIDLSTAIKLNQYNGMSFLNRGIAYIINNKIDNGCLDLSKAGELGKEDAYDLIKKYCQ